MPWSRFQRRKYVLMAIRETKILAKISVFKPRLEHHHLCGFSRARTCTRKSQMPVRHLKAYVRDF